MSRKSSQTTPLTTEGMMLATGGAGLAQSYRHSTSSAFAQLQRRLYSSASPAAPPPNPQPPAVKFRNYPLRYAIVFPVLHSSIAWTLLGPTYLFLSATGLTPLFLAGPQGAAMLKTRIPSLVPNGVLYGLNDCRSKSGRDEVTVEEWMEVVLRKAAKNTWGAAKTVRGLVNSFSSSGSGKNAESKAPSKLEQVAYEFGQKGLPDGQDAQSSEDVGSSKWGAWFSRAKDVGDAVLNHNNSSSSQQQQGAKGVESEEEDPESVRHRATTAMRGYISSQAEGIKVRDLADAAAAWVLVKCLLPVRIPLSLWLTPKVVRASLRRAL
ncbi:unnamed protein product [Jaminaea pallidilutea]